MTSERRILRSLAAEKNEGGVGGDVDWGGVGASDPTGPQGQGSRLKSASQGRLPLILEDGVSCAGTNTRHTRTHTHAHSRAGGGEVQTCIERLLCVTVSVFTCTVLFLSSHCTDEDAERALGSPEAEPGPQAV